MKIAPFGVEQWMNEHEERAVFNIGETCVRSLTLDELLAFDDDPERALAELRALQLTYGHIYGAPELRALVAGLYEGLAPEQTLVTNGAIGANFLAQYALVEPGDRVVCVQPTYQQLFSVPVSFGAEVVPLPLRPEHGWLPDLQELRSLLQAPTAMVVINNPNNPTGALMDEQALRELVDVVRPTGAWLLADEVYRRLEHDGVTGALGGRPLRARHQHREPLEGLLTRRPASGLDRRAAGGDRGLRRAPGLHDDQRRAARRASRHDRPARERQAARAQPGDRARERRDRRPLGAERAAALLRAAARRHDRLRALRVRPAVGELCQRLFDATGAFVVPGAAFDWEGWFRLGYAFDSERLIDGLGAISRFLRTLED
jgi:aspartate/methionine/tyrosine aminotransferase